MNNEFEYILLLKKDVLNIINREEKEVYLNYKFSIQKSDYARYIVLKYYGRIYRL